LSTQNIVNANQRANKGVGLASPIQITPE